MKTLLISVLATALGLAACTSESTKVERAAVAPAPPPAPAPTVVYQAPAPVIQAPAPTPPVVAAPTPGKVVVDYKGAGGFELAQQKATTYCEQHGSGGARLVTNDGVGHATFDCL